MLFIFTCWIKLFDVFAKHSSQPEEEESYRLHKLLSVVRASRLDAILDDSYGKRVLKGLKFFGSGTRFQESHRRKAKVYIGGKNDSFEISIVENERLALLS